MKACNTCKVLVTHMYRHVRPQKAQTLKLWKYSYGRILGAEPMTSRNEMLYLASNTGTSAREGSTSRERARRH